MKKSKKIALTLAVLGLISSGVNTNYWGGPISSAEAAKVSTIGEVTAFAKDSNPTGYLLCDGREVSRTEYADLFAEIGTKYGEGDGETTFNLPNLVDRFVEGSTEAGTYIEAGLPNITGRDIVNWYASVNMSGALYNEPDDNYISHIPEVGSGGYSEHNTAFDASRSNPIYGKSDTVQPESLTMRYFIKATKTADGGDGVIEKDNEETISGDTAYKELRPTDGNYVKESNTTADNLTSLDEQVKNNTDSISQLGSDISAAEKRAIKEATAKAEAAEAAAKEDAMKKVSEAEANAKADATNKANQARQDAIDTAASDATSKANTAETNAKSYTDLMTDAAKTYSKTYTDEVAKGKANVELDNINEDGKNVIRELAKNTMRESGIDTSGDTIVINKPMTTKNVNVEGDAVIHGDTTIGDDSSDKFVVNATSEFNEDVNFNKDVHIAGNLETDGNSVVHGNSETDGDATIHGNQYIDGNSHIEGTQEIDKDLIVHGDVYFDKGIALSGSHIQGNQEVDGTLKVGDNATFGKDIWVEGVTNTGALISRGDAVIGGNTHIYGDTKIDGDVYGRSFNIDGERYIDKSGINANGHKVRNVADGEISANSLDAVNGRQLHHVQESLSHDVTKVGAQTAAMANLHPMDFEYGDKVSIAAAVGGYKDSQAFALGAFVKPTQKSMFSLTGTLGSAENMYGMGFTQKFGKKADFEHMTENQLHDELSKLSKDADEIREHDKQIMAENAELKQKLAESDDKVSFLQNAFNELKAQFMAIKKKIK